ncbi:MAG: Fis family transcriptional regulator [Desulfobacterales bacterium GWB2_56_26]|nr:MAG: Fis family transcriptional regulator [Desulfobacterales bacterium GWB2_56_26]
MSKGHILIIEDDQAMGEMLDFGLSRRGFTSRSLISGQAGLEAISSEQPDVLLTDINLPDFNGIQVCREVAEKWPEIPVIMMTAFGSLETAIEAIRAGAYDFITKPLDMDLLSLCLTRAVAHRNLKKQVKLLSEEIERIHSFSGLLGESPIMQELFDRLKRIAATDTSVLITGESGSGKEITARALHEYSRRKDRPFVAINCSALPENLLESELFGHVKGAFTNAWQDRTGLLLEASGGTLFLDEIGDMPLSLQPKLLRALEERTVRPVGGNKEMTFEARVLAATNIDIEKAVAEGRFREDLYYRLNVIKVDIPPLRKRGTDILLLARKFINDFADKLGKNVTGLAESTIKRLLGYEWPGNVRELRNAMEHGVVMTLFEKIVPEDLPQKIQLHTGRTQLWETEQPAELMSLDEMTERYIAYVLKMTKGNQTLAAQILAIDRKTLYRRLQKPAE